MKNMRLLVVGSSFLLACSGINCSSEQQEQVQKPRGITIAMRSTSTTLTDLVYPPVTGAEVCVENVSIETATLTCTADTGLINEETGQIRLVGDVVIRTVDGIKFTAEEAVFWDRSPVENSYSLAR